MKLRGFTLIEVLTCIAIIAVVSALTYPALAGAKLGGKKSVSRSNLRQLWLAIEIYRQDHQAYADVGSPSMLGLPSDDYFHIHIEGSQKLFPPHQGPTKIFHRYYYYPPNEQYAQPLLVEQFVAWSKACGPRLPLVADFNFNEEEISPFNPYKTRLGIGIDLGGTVTTKRRLGDVFSPGWWGCNRLE